MHQSGRSPHSRAEEKMRCRHKKNKQKKQLPNPAYPTGGGDSLPLTSKRSTDDRMRLSLSEGLRGDVGMRGLGGGSGACWLGASVVVVVIDESSSVGSSWSTVKSGSTEGRRKSSSARPSRSSRLVASHAKTCLAGPSSRAISSLAARGKKCGEPPTRGWSGGPKHAPKLGLGISHEVLHHHAGNTGRQALAASGKHLLVPELAELNKLHRRVVLRGRRVHGAQRRPPSNTPEPGKSLNLGFLERAGVVPLGLVLLVTADVLLDLLDHD